MCGIAGLCGKTQTRRPRRPRGGVCFPGERDESTCDREDVYGFRCDVTFVYEICTSETQYPIYRKLLNSEQFLYYYSLELFNLSHYNKIDEFIEKKINIIKSIEPALFRQNFQSTFDISLIKKRIDKVKKNSKKSSNINSLITYKDSLLNIELSSNNLFPVSFNSDTILLNQTLFGGPLSFSLRKTGLSTNSLKYKINYKFLHSFKQLNDSGYLVIK